MTLKTQMSGAAVLLAILALQGCSTNPSVSGGGTIQDFARGLDGQRYSFDLAGRVLTPSMSGALVTGQRIPKGLLVALAPAQERCGMDGGKSSFTDLEAVEPARFKWLPWDSQPQLPRRMLCLRGGAQLWALEMQYGDVSTAPVVDPTLGTRLYLSMRMRMQLVTADQFAARLRNEEAQAVEREKAAAGQRERQTAFEQERQQRLKDSRDEALRDATQRQARVADFRAHLKAGDRFRWASPPTNVLSHLIVGLVVRVEGALAFVQFENLTMSVQQTRYVPKDQLEPIDGPTPGMIEIK